MLEPFIGKTIRVGGYITGITASKYIQLMVYGFDEIETDDPLTYVRGFLKDAQAELSVDRKSDGTVTVYAVADGLTQKFIFTPI